MSMTIDARQAAAGRTVFTVLFAISASHLINDMLQAVLPAVYPLLAKRFRLSYGRIGLITLTFQAVGSLLQPGIGLYTDRHKLPWSLAVGMTSSLAGLVVLAEAPNYGSILAGAALLGLGSAIFHPESSRVARLASGGRHGMAQSLFQVGGNAGSSLGPLLAAFVVLPYGQHAIAWFAAFALLGIATLASIGRWYGRVPATGPQARGAAAAATRAPSDRRRVRMAVAILALLVVSKYLYLTSLQNYYIFYLIHHFHVSVRNAQLHLFLFLGAVALGTFVGGPIGDRVGRKVVIQGSILGVLPFTLMLPHADLAWTAALSVVIGLILSSAFSAIIVFAQDLLPGRVGMVAGLFFGLAFGIGGIGAASLGGLADRAGIDMVFRLCAWLPAIGLLAVFLPDMRRRGAAA